MEPSGSPQGQDRRSAAAPEKLDRPVDRRTRVRPLAFALLTLPFVGCLVDDWNGQPYVPAGGGTVVTDDTGVVEGTVALAGTWRSEGGDLSELFSGDPFHYVSVEATFAADGSYVVSSTDRDGTSYVLTGVWSGADGQPGTVSLSQTEPYEAEAEGIWQVDGDTLTYEVVQTIPDYGFVPPTPAGGFGSTSGPGLTPGLNVQLYQRVR